MVSEIPERKRLQQLKRLSRIPFTINLSQTFSKNEMIRTTRQKGTIMVNRRRHETHKVFKDPSNITRVITHPIRYNFRKASRTWCLLVILCVIRAKNVSPLPIRSTYESEKGRNISFTKTSLHTKSLLTSFPSRTPSATPSSPLPSNAPSISFAPVLPLSEKKTIDNISMTLSGINPLDKDGKKLFENLTKQHIEWFFNDAADSDSGRNKRSQIQQQLFDMRVEIKVTNMNPPFKAINNNKSENGTTQETDESGGNEDGGGRKRYLAVNSPGRLTPQKWQIRQRSRKLETNLEITFSQTIQYRVRDINYDIPDLVSIVKEPFNNISKRIKYVDFLKIHGKGTFDTLERATLPIKLDDPKVGDDSKGLDVLTIVMLILGVMVVLFLGGLLILKIQSKKMPMSRPQVILPDVPDSGTLQTDPNNGVISPESIADYHEGQQSVATIDPDYQSPFNSSGPPSSSGGTIGELTRNSRFSGADSILTPASALGTQSIYTDDASFEAHLRGANQPIPRPDIFDVIAPPGKLGVVIDTPNSGAPVVYTIKENCPIADQLREGDKVIYVDGEDVRNLTAVQVSRLIGEKSANPERRFTIMRSSVDG